MQKIKVLVAGFQNIANPLVNNIKEPDVEVVWTGADKSGFDKDAKIVVIADNCINIEKRAAVLAHYQGKAPIIKAWRGYSDIAESFKEILFSVRSLKVESKVPAGDLAVPKKWIVDKKAPAAIPTPIPTPPEAKPSKGYDRDAIFKAVAECYKAKFKNDEITAYLNAEGLTDASGSLFTNKTMLNYFYRVKNNDIPKGNQRKRIKAKPFSRKTKTSTEPTPATAPTTQIDQLGLITKVLESTKLSAQEKLDTISRINKGEVVKLEWLEHHLSKTGNSIKLVQRSINVSPDASPTIVLNKDQCKLILLHINVISDFLKGDEV